MKFIICLILVALLVLDAHAWLFGPKKVGCEGKPCKNKGNCIADKADNAKYSCICPTGFYGKDCENKDGCQNKPCKSGSTCVVDHYNQKNYTCLCAPGQLGKNCEISNKCIPNPCKNGGSCTLDAKFKANCACPHGLAGKNCNDRDCRIAQFKGKNFKSLPKMHLDQSIIPQMKELDKEIGKCKVVIQHGSTFTTELPALKFAPLTSDSELHAGRAFTVKEFVDSNGRTLCNSICMMRSPIPSEPARCVIEAAKKHGFEFDPLKGLFHSNIHKKDSQSFRKLKETAQVGCKDKNF